MHSGRIIFSQLMDYVPRGAFELCVNKYPGNYRVRHFTCRSQFFCMAFGQLAYRNGLKDIVACLNAHQNKLYHMCIQGGVSLNNLSNANMNRDWRIYAEFAQVLIDIAIKLYAGKKFSEEIREPVYALDSTTIFFSRSLFPWVEFRETRGDIKLHTVMELPSSIPTVIDITEARPHDVKLLDRLNRISKCGAFFVIRVKCKTRLKRRYSYPKDSSIGIISDQTVFSDGINKGQTILQN